MVKAKKKKSNVKVISVRKPMKKKKIKKSATQKNLLMQFALKIDYQLGKYAFIVGVLSSIIFTAINKTAIQKEMVIFLLFLGLVIGLINITHKERSKFLVAVIALIVTNAANVGAITLWGIGLFLQTMLVYLTILFAPAGLVVALELIYSLARDR